MGGPRKLRPPRDADSRRGRRPGGSEPQATITPSHDSTRPIFVYDASEGRGRRRGPDSQDVVMSHRLSRRRRRPTAQGLAATALLAVAAGGCTFELVPANAAVERGEARPVLAAQRGPTPAPYTDLRPDEQATVALFENAGPSVVYITAVTRRRDFFGRHHRRGAAGHRDRIRLGPRGPHRHQLSRRAGQDLVDPGGHARPDQLRGPARRGLGPARSGGAAHRRPGRLAASGPAGQQRPGPRRTERVRHREPLRLQRHP